MRTTAFIAACWLLSACSCGGSRGDMLNKPYSGSCDEVIALVRKGANVNVRDAAGTTPLHKAAAWGKDEVARLLIEHGANVRATDDQGNTPLHLAAASQVREQRPFPKQDLYPSHEGLVRVTALLLEKGADPNAENGAGDTSLHIAAAHGSLDTARVLLDHGAKVNARNHEGETPLHLAVAREAPAVVVELLLDHGADGNARDARGDTPLHRMVYRGLFDAGIVRLLVRHGADVSARNADGLTPLELMAKKGSPRDAEKMKQAIADAKRVP